MALVDGALGLVESLGSGFGMRRSVGVDLVVVVGAAVGPWLLLIVGLVASLAVLTAYSGGALYLLELVGSGSWFGMPLVRGGLVSERSAAEWVLLDVRQLWWL